MMAAHIPRFKTGRLQMQDLILGTEGLPGGTMIEVTYASDTTRGIDGKRTKRNDLNLKWGDVAAPLAACNDNGPTQDYMASKIAADVPQSHAANDNWPKERLHIKEMFERGELGNGPPENQYHWFVFQRLRRDLRVASGEPVNDSAESQWRELMPEFLEGFFGNRMNSIETDEGLIQDDENEFIDTSTPSYCRVVDNAREELEPIESHVRATQIKARAIAELGYDFELLNAVIESNLTARKIGESTGLRDRATASARGKLMLHAALRNLGRFYSGLDRLEADPLPRPVVFASGNGFWNQTRGPVIKLYDPRLQKRPFYGAYSSKPTPRYSAGLL
jgi:hypothetical protein